MERKLAAILNADVKGYSRLMGDDEAATVRTINAYRDLMAVFIQEHRGRLVDFTGDNLLAEFASVVDAVQCAVEIQEALRVRNAALPEHRRMEFRIGINLGDVIVEGDRIYGDGVNVAARVQTLAEGGGVCISGAAYDQVKNKLGLAYESLGEQTVKNIAELVRVYRLRMEPGPAAVAGRARRAGPRSRLRAVLIGLAVLVVVGGSGGAIWRFASRPSIPPGLELPDEPSIAVLPFVNVGADPKQEHFSDGMTEEIITTLSKVSGLFVIASNSVFTYKGKPVKVQQVSRELGVRYVLEGSVRRSDPRIRVTAQLVDAATGHHLWAERYDRELKDVFAIQDEIAEKIVTALRVKLTQGEQVRVSRRTTDNVQAWELFSQAVEQHLRVGGEGRAQARLLYEKAIAADPRFAAAYAGLGFLHAQDARFGETSSSGRSLERAFELAQEALALDDSLPEAHASLAYVYLMRRQHTEAIAEAEQAVALLPSGAHVTRVLAEVLRAG
jgi:adenylate cyclase